MFRATTSLNRNPRFKAGETLGHTTTTKDMDATDGNEMEDNAWPRFRACLHGGGRLLAGLAYEFSAFGPLLSSTRPKPLNVVMTFVWVFIQTITLAIVCVFMPWEPRLTEDPIFNPRSFLTLSWIWAVFFAYTTIGLYGKQSHNINRPGVLTKLLLIRRPFLYRCCSLGHFFLYYIPGSLVPSDFPYYGAGPLLDRKVTRQRCLQGSGAVQTH